MMRFLILTVHLLGSIGLAAALPRKEEFLVVGLDEVEPAYASFKGEMYAGALPMDNKKRKGKLMFWLFVPDGVEKKL
jgi:hypothetical protein